MGSILLLQSSKRKVIKFFNEIGFELEFIVSQPFMYGKMKSSSYYAKEEQCFKQITLK